MNIYNADYQTSGYTGMQTMTTIRLNRSFWNT